MFSWIPIYKEIADKLLGYETKQTDLIKILGDLQDKDLPVIYISDKDKKDTEIALEEIDPFTFFACFNRKIKKENRIEIVQYLKKLWNLAADVPYDFDGIPIVNNQSSWFFDYKKNRNKNDIPLLWTLFKEGLSGKIKGETFNDVLNIKKVGKKKITMGLFWTRPAQYINIDTVHAAFLKKYEIDTYFTDYKSYAEIIKQTSERIEKEFYELSYEAWQDWQDRPSQGETLGEKIDKEIDKKLENKEIKLENIPLNLILYGPPGTGKTFKIQNEYMPLFTDKVRTKSEYLAEVVEDLDWFASIVLAMLDHEKRKVPAIAASEAIKIKSKISAVKYPQQQIWWYLQLHTKEDCPNVNTSRRSEPYVFWKDENSTWTVDREVVKQRLPEIFKTWQKLKNFNSVEQEEQRRYDFITFHQSFSYEDFIEGIKPNINQSLDESILDNDSSYVIERGIFWKIANKARNNSAKKYALFIDEINRGNVASIFGELITLIEKDKRDKLTVKLPYSKENFTVPSNLYIIGTMNTADRSIEALDAALRRRFAFEELIPEPSKLSPTDMPIEGIDLEKMLETINKRINVLLDKDHLIGHSYFMKIENKSNPLKEIRQIFINNLIPLLEEYFYGDRAKIKMVLGPAFVDEKEIKDTDFFAIENSDNEITFEKNFTYEIRIPETLEGFKSIYEKSNTGI